MLMAIHNIDVKFRKLNFDDEIKHGDRSVMLTHYDIDCKTPLFLRFVNSVSIGIYSVGFKNAIQWLKTGE